MPHEHVHRTAEEIIEDIFTAILTSGIFPPGSKATYIELQNVRDMIDAGLPLTHTTCPEHLWRY